MLKTHKVRKGVIVKLRQSRTFKGLSVMLAMNLLVEIIHPTVSLALTEGPSQPEVQSFEPIGTTQMVDLFSGDFNYNIPLFNLPGPNGGYPVNLAYHAGVSMDDEASWVGLGWNINVGSLVRNMRGLPDDFLSTADSQGNWTGGDFIETKSDMKESWTAGINFSQQLEIFGGDLLKGFDGLNASLYFNNYRGLGINVGISTNNDNSSPYTLGLSLDSENGLGVSSMFTINKGNSDAKNYYSLGLSFNGSLSVDYSMKGGDSDDITRKTKVAKNGTEYVRRGSHSAGGAISYARNNFVPAISNRMTSYRISANLSFGNAGFGVFSSKKIGAFYSTQDFNNEDKKGVKRPVSGYSKMSYDQDYFTKDFVRQNEGQITRETPVLPSSFYTSDAYNSTGQGLAGYFRGYRNDVGYTNNPKLMNTSWGASVNLEVKKIPGSPSLTIDIPIASGTAFQTLTILPGTPASNHLDVGGAASFGWDKQGPWEDLNGLNYDFAYPSTENFYYKVFGEQTIRDVQDFDHINGTSLALAKFEPDNNALAGKREISAASNTHIQSSRVSTERVVRNTVVHSLNNSEVAHLGEFDVPYYDLNSSLDFSSAPNVSLNRSTRDMKLKQLESGGFVTEQVSIGKHNAGYKVLNEDGSYYVYGLPAYNRREVKNLYSVKADSQADPEDIDIIDVVTAGQSQGYNQPDVKEVDYKQSLTHKFIDKTTTSPYAHSYLLTSVQGADYVDLKNDGPTDDDLGYWVKFDYKLYDDDYKWRAPFYGANFNSGASHTGEDDKAAYAYGEKELWYLARMETKTHIAIFRLSPREDMKEAEAEYVNETDVTLSDNTSPLKIDRIDIYEKSSFYEDPNIAPLQSVHFDYDYSLCPASENSAATGGGKLTLKKVYFTSLNSTRGSLSPYEFDYNTAPNGYNATLVSNLINPAYKRNSYDAWGNYRPYTGKYQKHARFPYVAQFMHSWEQSWMSAYPDSEESLDNKKITQQANDLLASSWSLRKIKLPSGGSINIQYESDDYSHVQHKIANQMFKIDRLGDAFNGGIIKNILYEPGSVVNFENNPEYRRIYFKLEEPIATTQSDIPNKVYKDYVEPLIKDEEGKRNLYFKTKVNLKSNVEEYISGYVGLEDYSSSMYGVDQTSSALIDGVQKYTIGFVTIESTPKRGGGKFESYHPIALHAWNYIQSNAPELLNPANISSSQNGTTQSVGDVVNLITNLISFIPSTAASLKAVRFYCQSLGLAATINTDESGIRLASPDRKKFGGGHRVKEISISDEWNTATGENSRTYGQVYDYTTTDENGRTISSGVAAYEPQAGGDENALKYPISFFGKQATSTSNNLFIEAPYNEALFPGASVGYRMVTVRSLNTSTQEKARDLNPSQAKGRTGGITVHEFYTAKDFPTIIERSVLGDFNNTRDVFNVPIPIPFIGSIKRNYYHGSQAFKIELNDMHGKPKAVRSYELNNYEQNSNPITEATYEYQTEPIVYQGESVYRLNNEVKIIENNGTHNLASAPTRLMGVESELFTDQRENKNFWNEGGLDFNIDVVLFGFAPSFWPSYSNHKTMFRTYVTNKVVHRSGILKKTKSRDLQTSNETEILAYDEKSGVPILSKVKNEFGDDFYSYNIPAYYHFDQMGHAYRNIDFTAQATFEIPASAIGTESYGTSAYVNVPATTDMIDNLVRGDELLIYGPTNPYIKGYFIGWIYSGTTTYAKIHLMEPVATSGAELHNIRVIRSGRRNHYSTVAANYLTKNEIDLATGINAETDVAVVDGYQITTKNIEANTVLSATATLFRDNWNNNNLLAKDIKGGYNLSPDITNPYLTGNSGIWRPYKSYTYVGSRKSNASMSENTSANPQLYNDGVFEDYVPMFTWDIGNLENYVSNWEWVNEITRFSGDSYEIENINRLGIYSSALYGYDNSLTIGVGGNASYYEMGVVDFETFSTLSVEEYGSSMVQTNLNFHNKNGIYSGSFYLSENLNIRQAIYDGTNLSVVTDVLYADFDGTVYDPTVGLTLVSSKSGTVEGNLGFYLNGQANFSSVSGYLDPIDGNVYARFNVEPYYNVLGEQVLLNTSWYTGKVRTLVPRPPVNYSDVNARIQFVSGKAHTGKKSMKVLNVQAFDQPQLKLVKDKKYVLSMWVSRDQKSRTYEQTSSLIALGEYSNGVFYANQNITVDQVTYSKVIEGWQKVDIEFYTSADYYRLGIQFNPGANPLYVDDVRFSPKTGGMTSYVYDPDRLWLRASMNVDNYATLFYYDEEGNLTLKKQETEDGIFTITESRGHVVE